MKRFFLLLLLPLFACSSEEPPVAVSEAECPIQNGEVWHAQLDSPGGDLPFFLRFVEEGGTFSAQVLNGEEEAPTSHVECSGSELLIGFSWYDSEITATFTGDTAEGRWRRTSPGGTDTVLTFSARKGEGPRFGPAEASDAAETIASVAGHWSVLFRDEDGEEEARGEMDQAEDGTVTGTFLTPTGDYRFLAGSYAEGQLRLSTFDGAHAFLFSATAGDDGGLTGDFWSRDTYHATWTAQPIAPEEEVLPDPWQLAQFEGEDNQLRFAFPDLEGNIVSHDDPRFAGKVVLVNLFGTWCPNCNDEAPHLAEWYRTYRDQGLEIVGLAYEFTGDMERDQLMVTRFGERYGIEYPLLLAGTNDKTAAAATLPGLSAVIAYPTSIFIDRTGKVRHVHSGFSGPGTGEHYTELVAELEGTIEELLAEPSPEGA